jgi:hypothetical protein
MMTVQEILHWKQELRRVRQEFLQVWKKCPRCGAKWADIAWDAESDHEWLIVECKNRHLFRANEEFWLFDYDRKNPGVYAPSEEVRAYAG